MTVGNHANVVFLDQQSENTLLQRYDATTGAIQTILQIHQADPALGTNVSPDGQWVLFGAVIQSQSAIQLVRMDGQQLQTLYCAPPQSTVGNLVLSPDQHNLLFSQVNLDETESILYLLDMRTGKLQTELSSLQPNYPVFGQYLAHASSLSLLSSATFLILTSVQNTHERSVVPASSRVAMAREPLDQPSRFGLTSAPQALLRHRS